LENCKLYGGPLLHFVGGDIDIEGQSDTGGLTFVSLRSQDISEESHFGGYIGAEWSVINDGLFHIEFQATRAAWAVGLGAIWRVE